MYSANGITAAAENAKTHTSPQWPSSAKIAKGRAKWSKESGWERRNFERKIIFTGISFLRYF
jgi:hypothetical protein